MTTLTLGGITFSGFEVPSSINFGGSQRTVVHRIVGAGRAVDTTGYDPKDNAWSGRFRGPSAVSRARALDAMCQAGLPVPLTWDVFSYSVLIQDFDADYQKPFEIPYRIVCVSATSPAPAAASTIDNLVSGDTSLLSSLTSGISSLVSGATGAVASLLSPITSALAPITSNLGQATGLLSQFGSIAGLSVSQLAPTTTLLNQVQGGLTGLTSIASGQLFTGVGQIGGVLPGSPQGGLPAVLSQIANLQTAASALTGRGAAGRLVNNVNSAGASG